MESVDVRVHAPVSTASVEILTPDALRFIGFLCDSFEDRRQFLLAERKTRAKSFDAGEVPRFLPPQSMHDSEWKCASIPNDVQDRRVEITGPVDRKMVINGLNSGANVYMADFEDSSSPTWSNMIEGQMNLRDATRGTITYTNRQNGKLYSLKKEGKAVLFVRPRGWHLDEGHVTVNGRVASGSIFDFGLYLFHNHQNLMQSNSGPYFYLPKLENHLEARLWNDVFIAAQKYLGIEVGTIRATVLLETITASFEMEEILYELRDHSLGLNCGRWDYLFSYIKKLKNHSNKIAPDRSLLTMNTPLMEAYVKRLVYICHRRGTFAIGGMSASIPIRDNPTANKEVLQRIERDKLLEVKRGHDGTWVAHPALIQTAKAVFDAHMTTDNQIEHNLGLDGSNISEDDLLELPRVPYGEAITSDGLQKGIGIVLCYTEAWLRGVGCIPLHGAMEDAATAEISRVQIWQWIHHGIVTQDDDIAITKDRVRLLLQNELKKHCNPDSKATRWYLAAQLVEDMLTADELDDFLTNVCYPYIISTSDDRRNHVSIENERNNSAQRCVMKKQATVLSEDEDALVLFQGNGEMIVLGLLT